MSAFKQRDAMRPVRLSDFTGQPKVGAQLEVLLGSARKRSALPDHVLLSGPPGLGKTTLAHIVGHELDLPVTTASGPGLETPADVLMLLQGRAVPGVVFIDEIHRMGRAAEETLYPAMEDGSIPIRLGEGAGAEHVEIPVVPFTLVGATTQVGLLSGPLRDRFGFQGRLRPYSDEALTEIVQANAGKLGLELGDGAAGVIASRSRGTPRVANGLLSRVRDVAAVADQPKVSADDARASLDKFGVDELGLDEMSRTILRVLCTQFGGGPVGLNSLASAVGETSTTVESVYEPHLLSVGMLRRGSRGRVATELAFEHLELDKV